MDAGAYIYRQASGTIDTSIIEHLTAVTARNLDAIRRHESCWQKLASNSGLLTAALDKAFEKVDWDSLKAATGIDMDSDQEQIEDYCRLWKGLKDAGNL